MARLWERLSALPSSTTISAEIALRIEATHARKHASNASGSRSENTRTDASHDGMPLGHSRNCRDLTSCARPDFYIWRLRMHFEESPLGGVFVISLDPRKDDRGFFSRAYCTQEFEGHGLKSVGVQCNMASNFHQGTLRGLHYQVPPAAEAKFFRCIRGANYHVVVDIRPDSSTYLKHFGLELSADNRLGLYIPELFAHGYQALTDGSEAFYMVSEYYTPGCERGLRHDDPALGIQWPQPVTTISDKDSAWPLLPVPPIRQPEVSR